MKYQLFKILFFLSAFIFNISFAQVHERWDVKTLSDGFKPSLSSAKTTTVKKIGAMPRIRVKNTQPRLNFEKQVFKITGTVSRKTLENDGDYHIELSDGSLGDSTIACESVDPANDSAKKSSLLPKFKSVRMKAKSLSVGDKVTITGVLFQDKYHNPSPLRIRNFKELHPILKID